MALLPNTGLALTYDDVLLVPKFSEVISRSEVSLDSGSLGLKNPFISANMDTITEEAMAIDMSSNGGMGIIHRFMTYQRLEQIVARCNATGSKIGLSVGINDNELTKKICQLADKSKSVIAICIDVAHGHHIGVIETIKFIKTIIGNSSIKLIAGNVATGQGAIALAKAGADIIKCGVGPGSCCSTRIATGHGVPQLTAIQNIKLAMLNELGSNHPEIIADGGIRNSGDIAKAIAAGATYVMIGGLFAGTTQTPGRVVYKDGRPHKLYRGMASYSVQKDIGKGKIYVEGVKKEVEFKGDVGLIITELENGLRSACSYSGVNNLSDLAEVAELIPISHNSYIESAPKE